MTIKNCIICGKEINVGKSPHYSTEDGVVCSSRCHTKHYWNRIIDNEDRVVIDGVCYTVGREDIPDEFKGYSGRYFRIEKFTGEVIETNNLRYNDEVPEEYEDELPNNAKFLL